MDETWTMIVTASKSIRCFYTNHIYCNPVDAPFNDLPCRLHLARLRDNLVFSVRCHKSVAKGCIALNTVQMDMANVELGMQISMSRFIPPQNINFTSLTLDVTPLPHASIPPEERLCEDIRREVDAVLLSDLIRRMNVGQVLSLGQELQFEYQERAYLFKVKQAVIEGKKYLDGMKLGMISPETCIIFKTSTPKRVKILNQHEPRSIFQQKELDFQSLGVAVDESFKETLLRVLASRRCYPRITSKYGVKHVKGVLILGPTGTGKTVIARALGIILNNTKMVNARALLGKSVDESVQNVRNLFADAEREEKTRGDNSDLHIIILDEIDAICKSKSATAAGAQVRDSISNELISKLDGTKSPSNNIFLIGITNQKEMLNEPLVRPGRLEIVLPTYCPFDDELRLQILEIHMRKLRQNSLLAQDVDMQRLACDTVGFNGAMIEMLVQSAVSHALSRSGVDFTELVDEKGKVEVTMDDFLNAFAHDVRPYVAPGASNFDSSVLNDFAHATAPYVASGASDFDS